MTNKYSYEWAVEEGKKWALSSRKTIYVYTCVVDGEVLYGVTTSLLKGGDGLEPTNIKFDLKEIHVSN